MSNSTNINDLPVAKENIQMTINDPGQMQQHQHRLKSSQVFCSIGQRLDRN